VFHHITVLKEEALAGLNIREDGIYVDCTVGGAGHSEAIAARLGTSGRLIGFDQDERALVHATERLAAYADRVKLVRSNFRYIERALRETLGLTENELPQVDGFLFDLGVSSPQLDEAERGFSYQADAPLDMRMDQRQALDARTVVNEWDESEIARILFEYGEEKFSRRIAATIVNARKLAPIDSTGELVELIKPYLLQREETDRTQRSEVFRRFELQ
jgi:16S rRNA (cytosine1402-N4)-methyltransferase